MKLFLCLTLSLCLALCACAPLPAPSAATPAPQAEQAPPALLTPSPAPAVDEAALKAQSAAYLEQLNGGAYDDFYANLTATLLAAMPRDQFASQWQMVLTQTGPFMEAEEPVVSEVQGMRVVETTNIHSRYRIKTTFTYDAEGKVAGFFNQLLPLIVEPQVNEAWEEIPITLGFNENKLSGLLTLPKGVEKAPVVILLQGSGPSNMDEAIGAAPNRPFADIAHGLAEKGVASLRYDKRSYAFPMDVAAAGVEEEYLLDAAEAIKLCAQNPALDPARIFVAGHSQGGMLAPKIAQDNPAVAGMISLAGSLRHLADISLTQTERMLNEMPELSQTQKNDILTAQKAEMEKVKSLDQSDTKSVVAGLSARYWNSLNAIDQAAIAKSLTVPMLILQGENDFQVTVKEDYTLWQEILKGRDNVTFRLYPGLTHLFTPGPGDKLDIAIYDAPANVAPEVIEDMAAWMHGSIT